jgi:hypothetical protein
MDRKADVMKHRTARLGINRSTLQFRMKKLGIMRPPVPGEASV